MNTPSEISDPGWLKTINHFAGLACQKKDKHASINEQIKRGKSQTHQFHGEFVPAGYF